MDFFMGYKGCFFMFVVLRIDRFFDEMVIVVCLV